MIQNNYPVCGDSLRERPDDFLVAAAEDFLNFWMRTGDNVSGHQFACPFCRSNPGVYGRLDGADFATHHDRHIPAANLFLAD